MTKGIHHITAIASDGADNVAFYTQVLGLRLVKKTVNQDDVSTYHLFFGDTSGSPGMDLTFFIFKPHMQGKRGAGLVTMISLAVPETSLSFWKQRFVTLNIEHHEITDRFDRKRLVFYDADDQQLELVGLSANELENNDQVWTTDEISQDVAIRSFHAATLTVRHKALIIPILTHVFNYTSIEEEGNRELFVVTGSDRGQYLEVEELPDSPAGLQMSGTVHHIAFRAEDEQHQQQLRNKVIELGLHPTEEIDRFYFKSVYFRTPSGILFEIATDGPGFTADEKKDVLGERLALPPFLEPQRANIEAGLPPLT